MFYLMQTLVVINGLNYEFLNDIEKDILDILDEFCIMGFREMVEFNKRKNGDKEIGE